MSRKTGELKKFIADKGYGFIKSENGDVFFHVTDSADLDQNALNEGVNLSYEMGTDSRSGKSKAINVEVAE